MIQEVYFELGANALKKDLSSIDIPIIRLDVHSLFHLQISHSIKSTQTPKKYS